MTPQDFTQWIPAGATAVCAWFLVWIFSDFRDFKKSTYDQIDKLRSSQQTNLDKLAEKNAEMSQIVAVMKFLHKNYQQEVTTALTNTNKLLNAVAKVTQGIRQDTEQTKTSLKLLEESLNIFGQFVKALKTKVFQQDEDLKSIKVKISENDLMIKKKPE